MTIYIVATGEHGEGQSPRTAFGSLSSALKHVADEFGVTPALVNPGEWMASLGNGCDEVWIYRLAVQS